MATNLMDLCFNCGTKTDPDWVFCRTCGSGLDLPETEPTLPVGDETPTGPKVELISRGWNAVDIDTAEHPTDPLDSNVMEVPLPPGALEVSADDIAVIETPADTQQIDEDPSFETETDGWDHLRTHSHASTAPVPVAAAAAAGQISLLSLALAALVTTVLRFYLNTRLDAFGEGTVSSRAVGDVETVADGSLIVMLGLGAITVAILGWWMTTSMPSSSFSPGSAGIVALISAAAGATLVAVFHFSINETVADAIAANSLMILGLGLLMMSCLAGVRAIGRVEEMK